MKGDQPRGAVAVGAAVALLLAGEPLSAQTAPAAVAFRLEGTAAVVDVVVNGTGPHRFALDTGSSHSFISARLAASLGSPRVARTRVSTPTGEQWAAVIRLDRIEWGPLSIAGLLPTEADPDVLDPSGQVVGVIGQDVLGARPITIDYRRRIVEWPVEDHRGPALELDTSGVVWTVAIPHGNRVVHLVPDSGTEGLVLFARPGQGLPESHCCPGTETATVSTLVGQSAGRFTVVRELRLGRAALVNEPAVVLDGAGVDRAHGDGLLPLHRFSRVTIDAQQRSILFESVP